MMLYSLDDILFFDEDFLGINVVLMKTVISMKMIPIQNTKMIQTN